MDCSRGGRKVAGSGDLTFRVPMVPFQSHDRGLTIDISCVRERRVESMECFGFREGKAPEGRGEDVHFGFPLPLLPWYMLFLFV